MKTLKIFSDSPLSDSAKKLLKEGVAPHQVIFPEKISTSVLSHAEMDPRFPSADIAFGQPVVADVLRTGKLRWIHLTSAGYTRYDTPEFREAVKARGLIVTNSSAVYDEPCAEHVFAFMLAHARKLPRALQARHTNGSAEWNALRNSAVSLRNQKLVILGYGAIAIKLLELLRPFAMNMVALRRRPRGDEEIPIVTPEQLRPALADADHVINILPENADSVHFISAERLAWMKPGAVFYNIGRGKTVDQSALLDALRARHLEAAWLDVTDPEPLPPDHPLFSTPNCFITPHAAGGHRNEAESLVRHFLDNFRCYLNEQPLKDRIM